MLDPEIAELTPTITHRTLRQFAALWLIVFGALAYWQGFANDRAGLGAALVLVAVTVGIAGLVRPQRIALLFTTLMAVTSPIGHVISLILLAAIFYLVLSPVGWFFRLIGRDALHVGRPERASHWTPKAQVTDLRDYTSQS